MHFRVECLKALLYRAPKRCTECSYLKYLVPVARNDSKPIAAWAQSTAAIDKDKILLEDLHFFLASSARLFLVTFSLNKGLGYQ